MRYRFSNHSFFSLTSPRSRGRLYAREAERQFELHNFSLVTLQTALLLGAFYGTEGDSRHESLYYALACRIGSLLNLPNLSFENPLSRELGIRGKSQPSFFLVIRKASSVGVMEAWFMAQGLESRLCFPRTLRRWEFTITRFSEDLTQVLINQGKPEKHLKVSACLKKIMVLGNPA